ncbi:kinase-like protein, partial [Coccomyxa subellipsoidea C-169]
ISDFEQGPILGTGSFGRVLLVHTKASREVCAIKALSKAHLIIHLRAERDVLRMVNHPGLVNFLGGFQDDNCVYFVMEYVCGGEFFRHLKAKEKLPEDHARFYAAEVLDAFEYLHSNDIVYRDLKPENLLLDSKGHIKVTDLGFAKIVGSGKRTYTLCGTPDYLAPEIILNKGHGMAVDWWAFGVFLYEMMAGFPPFYDEDVTNTYKKILSGRFGFPAHFSVNARDLIRKLLQADLSKRYGCLAAGTNDIKNHPWFKGLDWNKVARREETPPIRCLL